MEKFLDILKSYRLRDFLAGDARPDTAHAGLDRDAVLSRPDLHECLHVRNFMVHGRRANFCRPYAALLLAGVRTTTHRKIAPRV